MELPDRAARALEVIRRDARVLRYEVSEICHAGRYRLSVHYRTAAGEELRLGLLYDEDRAALQELCDRLVAGGAPVAA